MFTRRVISSSLAYNRMAYHSLVSVVTVTVATHLLVIEQR